MCCPRRSRQLDSRSARRSTTSSMWGLEPSLRYFASTLGLHPCLDDLVVLLEVEVVIVATTHFARCLACPKRPGQRGDVGVKVGSQPAGVVLLWGSAFSLTPGHRVPPEMRASPSPLHPQSPEPPWQHPLIGRPERRKPHMPSTARSAHRSSTSPQSPYPLRASAAPVLQPLSL